MRGLVVLAAVFVGSSHGLALTKDEFPNGKGSLWMPHWPEPETYQVPLWCLDKNNRGGLPRPNIRGDVTAEKPLHPRFKLMGQFSCTECYKIVDSAIEYCKRISPTSVHETDFVTSCKRDVYDFAFNKTTLGAKCQDFHDFVGDTFCPLDPCDHIALSKTNAPKAFCDSARCFDIKHKETYKPPLTCPAYVEHIMSACREMKKESGPHSRPKLTRKEGCKAFPPRFERNGCQVVFDALKKAADPMGVCSLTSCDGIVGGLAEFCEKELNLTGTGPVPVAGYPPSDENCDPHPNGMIIVRASYGVNCTHENHTNNILSSVRASCQGRLNCTFGNRNMQNKTSEWDPLKDDDTCIRAFEIHYRCHADGPLHIVHAPESAKYEARPIDCAPELSKTYQQSRKTRGPQQGYHVP